MNRKRKNIVWIASYPKSGNTWFRVFLENLLTKSSQPVNINNLNKTSISSDHAIFDLYSGLNSSELLWEEIDDKLPQLFSMISEKNSNLVYIKTHDAWRLNIKKVPVFHSNVTKVVIYIIRNPLDITISYARHNDISIEESINCITSQKTWLSGNSKRVNIQFAQYISSWSKHVESWIDQSGLPTHIIRYEDMLSDPLSSFYGILEKLNMQYSKKAISKAIMNSSFEELQKQEKLYGFREASVKSRNFFHEGRSGIWENRLNESHIIKIIDSQKEIMERFGYLPRIQSAQ